MYEVHPNNEGQWILYYVGDGGFATVAWFSDRDDAEFARDAFTARDLMIAEGYASPIGSAVAYHDDKKPNAASLQAAIGKWPGDETEEQISQALSEVG